MGIMGVTVLHNAPGDGATSEHPILEPPWDSRPSPAGSEDPQAIQMFFFLVLFGVSLLKVFRFYM